MEAAGILGAAGGKAVIASARAAGASRGIR
jgi:hypothetical protein